MVATAPHHMAIGFVAEYGDLLASDQVCDAAEILLGRDAPGRVVWGVEKDRLRRRILRQEALDISGVRPKLVRLSEGREHRPTTPSFDVRHVRRKIRAEDQHPIAWVEKRLAEELLENLGTWSDHYVLALGGDPEFVAEELSRRITEFRQTG